MAKFEDPLTDTTWFDSSDLSGTVMTMITGVVGLGFLFTLMAVARSTVVPLVADVLEVIPGVSAGGSGSGDLDFNVGGGGL